VTALPSHLLIKVDSPAEGAVRVIATGEIDAASAGQLEAALTSVLVARRAISLDLQAVSFIDSSALRVLMEARATAADAGLSFGIVAASPQVVRVLTMTGLDGLLPGG
jgi:anti-sigma B factor antagonist